MSFNRALAPEASPGSLPDVDTLIRQMDAMVDEGGREGPLKVQQGERRTLGAMETITGAGSEAMRSMSMDPVSAMRQTLAALRRHPYIAAVLLLGLGATIGGFARS